MTDANRPMYVLACGLTDAGRVRPHNEDAFVVADLSAAETAGAPGLVRYAVGPRGVLLAVSDGMGGASAGEIASALVLASVCEHLGSDCLTPEIEDAVRCAVELANRDVWEAARRRGFEGMGATLVAVLIHGQWAYVATVGDSRAYTIRKASVCQITKDQSYVEMLVDAGLLTRDQAATSQYRNVILQAMGARPDVTVALGRLELRAGDIVLLCSDGLSGKVAEQELLQVVETSLSLDAACARLVELANARGGEDNITVVLAQITGGDLTPARPGETASDTLRTTREFSPAKEGGGHDG